MEQKVDLSTLSADELKAALAAKMKEEKELQNAKRQEYENERNTMVCELIEKARAVNALLAEFKSETMQKLEAFKEKAIAYSDVRKDSKGGFSLRTTDGSLMVSYDRNTKPEYDERANLAESLLKEFLEDKVKKKDLQTYRTIAALMERNAKGDFTPSRIAALLKVEDNYDDERWIKAMQLFKESFQVRDISYSVSFYEKDSMGKDRLIPINITAV